VAVTANIYIMYIFHTAQIKRKLCVTWHHERYPLSPNLLYNMSATPRNKGSIYVLPYCVQNISRKFYGV